MNQEVGPVSSPPFAPSPEPARVWPWTWLRDWGAAEQDTFYRLLSWLLLAGPTIFALVVSFCVTPEQIESGQVRLSPPCTTQQLFHRPCPTCGLTRAFTALSHGRLGQGQGYHRGAVFWYGLFWVGAAVGSIQAGRSGRELYRARAQRRGA